MPNYVLSASRDKVVLRNFEGYISAYAEPDDYQEPGESLIAPYKPSETDPQEGIFGLLSGNEIAIKPEWFDQVHLRGGQLPRLSTDQQKGKALGSGNDEEVPKE
jgi:lysine 2,3-aminomutase